MAVVKEFRCFAHGPFDGKEAICPHGCTTVVREFRTAPAGRSAKTKASDAALENLAKKYNLTDMTNKGGSVGGSRKPGPDFKPIWGEMPKGNVFEVGKGERPATPEAALLQGAGADAALAGLRVNPNSVAAELSRKHGKEFSKEPTFMDVAKALKRPRPHAVGHEPGSQTDLARAIERAPAE